MKQCCAILTLVAASLVFSSCASEKSGESDTPEHTPLEANVVQGVSVIDTDGNTYPTVIIGDLQWMAENLRTTQYANGQPIDYPGDNVAAWKENQHGAFAWYDNDPSNGKIYGALYNWYAVTNPGGLCPLGWRVPDQQEWQRLTEYVGERMGNKLKSRRQVGSPFGGAYDTEEHPRWETFSQNYGEDLFGFGALPAGNRHASGTFVTKGANALFWSSSEVSEEAGFGWYMYHGYYGVDRGYGHKGAGFSVRCVRDLD